jgi:hypothetical protein
MGKGSSAFAGAGSSGGAGSSKAGGLSGAGSVGISGSGEGGSFEIGSSPLVFAGELIFGEGGSIEADISAYGEEIFRWRSTCLRLPCAWVIAAKVRWVVRNNKRRSCRA